MRPTGSYTVCVVSGQRWDGDQLWQGGKQRERLTKHGVGEERILLDKILRGQPAGVV
jgi:hypothetical protein